MPVYTYKCSCGKKFDEYRKVSNRDVTAVCQCGKPAPRSKFDECVNSTDHEYLKPVYSESLGCHPSQINEMKQRFPHHEYAPGGQLVIRSHNQYKRIRKELGFHDKSGYY